MVGGLGCSNWAENSIVEHGNGLQAELLVEFIALTAATNTRATQTKGCILEVRRLKGKSNMEAESGSCDIFAESGWN